MSADYLYQIDRIHPHRRTRPLLKQLPTIARAWRHSLCGTSWTKDFSSGQNVNGLTLVSYCTVQSFGSSLSQDSKRVYSPSGWCRIGVGSGRDISFTVVLWRKLIWAGVLLIEDSEGNCWLNIARSRAHRFGVTHAVPLDTTSWHT